MNKPVKRENAVTSVAGDDGSVLVGSAAVAEAVRRPLRELMDDRLLDALIERSRDQAGGLRLTGEGSLLWGLVKVVLERALEAELTAHLGYGKSERGGGAGGNARNGSIVKTVQTGVGRFRCRSRGAGMKSLGSSRLATRSRSRRTAPDGNPVSSAGRRSGYRACRRSPHRTHRSAGSGPRSSSPCPPRAAAWSC